MQSKIRILFNNKIQISKIISFYNPKYNKTMDNTNNNNSNNNFLTINNNCSFNNNNFLEILENTKRVTPILVNPLINSTSKTQSVLTPTPIIISLLLVVSLIYFQEQE